MHEAIRHAISQELAEQTDEARRQQIRLQEARRALAAKTRKERRKTLSNFLRQDKPERTPEQMEAARLAEGRKKRAAEKAKKEQNKRARKARKANRR